MLRIGDVRLYASPRLASLGPPAICGLLFSFVGFLANLATSTAFPLVSFGQECPRRGKAGMEALLMKVLALVVLHPSIGTEWLSPTRGNGNANHFDRHVVKPSTAITERPPSAMCAYSTARLSAACKPPQPSSTHSVSSDDHPLDPLALTDCFAVRCTSRRLHPPSG